MYKLGFAFSFLLFCLFAVSCSTEGLEEVEPAEQQATDEGWVSLFDGETSAGWRAYGKEVFPEFGWEIVDGSIHCVGSGRGEEGHGGDIITEKRFRNFTLELEWKVAEGGNSGIFYLAQEKEDQPIWQNAPEMQVLDNERHADAKLGKDGNRQAGSLYDLIPAIPQSAKPAGQWNEVRIVVQDERVEHWLNGERVLRYRLGTPEFEGLVRGSKFAEYPDFGKYREGHIGLQDHGDDVWYRNIKIKEP
jgi:hypothetical protein